MLFLTSARNSSSSSFFIRKTSSCTSTAVLIRKFRNGGPPGGIDRRCNPLQVILRPVFTTEKDEEGRPCFSRCLAATRSITASNVNTPPLRPLRHQHQALQARRSFSSSSSQGRRGGNDGKKKSDGDGFKDIDALSFTVSPQDALNRFYKWATDEQGLHYLLQKNSVRIGASYCPVWSFDVNARFVIHDEKNGKRIFNWKPEVLREAYGQQSVINLPGLAAYAGYSYRRSLVNPLHNTTLVFLGDETVPFGKWMLRPMEIGGQKLEIFPDPWNATRGRAFAIVKEELQAIANQEYDGEVEVQTEVLSSKRVYMPTYVIDYKVMGAGYRAFVSGCDAAADVSGDSHKVFGDREAEEKGSNFLMNTLQAAQASARALGGRGIFLLFQVLGGVFMRLLARLPIVGLFAGAFVGFRKIIQPFFAKKMSTAQWERQREHESVMEDRFDYSDDFVDSGSAQRYFRSNRGQILRHLSGEYEHEQGSYDWYEKWEEWARQQWEQQKQQQTYQQRRQQEYYYQQQQRQQQQQQQQQRQAKQKPKVDFKWDFDPNDPYSVLGIKRGATKSEVSTAYRKQIMSHHPDRQVGATEAEKVRALERTKIINDAYRKIKQEMK